MFDPIGMTIASVSNQMIPWGDGKLRQRISRAYPFGWG
jgi:hypothetical protein